MADWAFWMLIATTVGVAITGVGVGFVALTLTEMREATKHAADAAKSTAEAVRIAQQDSRAWLVVESIGATGMFISDRDRMNFGLNVQVENVGRTVAFDVAAHAWPYFLVDGRNMSGEIKKRKEAARATGRLMPRIIVPGKKEVFQALARPMPANLPPEELWGRTIGTQHVEGTLIMLIIVTYRTVGGDGLTCRAFIDPKYVIDRAAGKTHSAKGFVPADETCNTIE